MYSQTCDDSKRGMTSDERLPYFGDIWNVLKIQAGEGEQILQNVKAGDLG